MEHITITDKAYRDMASNCEIYLLSDFDIVESTFTSILEGLRKCYSDTPCVGFDLEWKPKVVYRSDDTHPDTYESDPPSENPVSLMQITINDNGKKLTYLIRMLEVFNREICKTLQYQDCALFQLLRDPDVLKFGVGITGDAKKLAYDYFVTMRGAVELGDVSQTLLASSASEFLLDNWPHLGTSMSLQSLVGEVCGVHLPKRKEVQCSDWEAFTLSHQQVLYAASDSYHALLALEKILEAVQSHSLGQGQGGDLGGGALPGLLRALADKGRTPTTHSSTDPATGSGSGSSKVASIRNGERCLSAAQTPIYESCCILSKHGQFLSYCDSDRLAWYLKKGLAEELGAVAVTDCIDREVVDPLFASGAGRIIKLNFEANGSGNLHDTYKRQMLRNRCVVCGLVDGGGASGFQLLHHHVVPKAYRRVFPTCMVSKNNHDILPMCRPCKAQTALMYSTKMEAVERQHIPPAERDRMSAEMRGNNTIVSLRENHSKVKSLCRSLTSPASRFQKKVKVGKEDGTKTVETTPVTADRILEIRRSLLTSLQSFCAQIDCSLYRTSAGDMDIQREVEALDIHDLSSVDRFLTQFEAVSTAAREAEGRRPCEGDGVVVPRNRETLVVLEIIKPRQLDDDPQLYIPLLHQFEQMWRIFFLECIRPRYMPEHWRVDFKKIDSNCL